MEILENEFWIAVRKTHEWNMFPPDLTKEYIINIFDDGNEKYHEVLNIWYKYGQWRDKIALVNSDNPKIRIESISVWKVLSK
jgi:hypothetical protein